jgi:hypothetical protein
MAYEVDFQVDQGTTFQKVWTVFTDSSFSIQANIAGFTASMNVAYSYDNEQVIASYSTGLGNMWVDTANSIVQVNIANNDFVNVVIPQGNDSSSIDLVYDVKITAANLVSYRIAQGTLTLNKEVTI